MQAPRSDSIFLRDGDYFVPTGLSRGPWDPDAQHAGAPAALLAHVAEQTVADSAFVLGRLTFELTRPIPVAPIKVQAESGRGRTVRRVSLVIEHDGQPVGRATALFLRESPLDTAPVEEQQLTPGPGDCREPFAVPGLADAHDGVETFAGDGMDIWIARGSSHEPGPAAAWFRLRAPLVADQPPTPAMRALAASDFGNGLSWTLPPRDFQFANTDLTVYLHRVPQGEWIGLDSETICRPNGTGLSTSTLYDAHGRIGMAHQNLVVREK